MFSTTRSSSHQQNRLDPRRQGARKRATQPRPEWLEDRSLLSTLTVLNNFDNGTGSLRAAIAAASSGDTIVFAPKLQGGQTITLASELDITKSLDIEGPGANRLTISGNNASRVFEIGHGPPETVTVTVTISGLTIANGQTPSTGTTTDGALGGGGILIDVGATLNLTSSAVVNNKAIAGAVLDVFGGGVLNLGTANVTACTFTGNQALGGTGPAGDFFGGSVGGAIDNFGGATLTVTGSTFTNNQAISTDQTGFFFGIGGAIENNAGFDKAHPSTATISNSTFTDNQAIGRGTDSSANGGGLDNEGTDATMTVTSSTLSGNQAIGGPGVGVNPKLNVASQGIGGGILNGAGSTLNVTNSTIIGNLAIGGDHSTPTKDNPLTGAGLGGGIANILGVLEVTNSAIFGNLAQGGAAALGDSGAGSGAGGGIENSFFSTAIITNSRIFGNQAIAGTGGSGTSVPSGLGFGGGIGDSFSSTATITGSTIIGNQAIGSGGSSGANGGAGLGGGIVVGINASLGFTDNASITVSNSVVASNLARGGAGGSGANGGDGKGGGIWFGTPPPPPSQPPNNSIDNSVITGNSALGGQAGAGGIVGNGNGFGGGVYITSLADVFLSPSTIVKGNHASTNGNDVFVQP
jgi:hypothetical protein